MSTVNEIAWMVGYEDPGSFRKVFSGSWGCRPATIDAGSALREKANVRSVKERGFIYGNL
jgi:transcriptional regulator GlxA family with amidase domain